MFASLAGAAEQAKKMAASAAESAGSMTTSAGSTNSAGAASITSDFNREELENYVTLQTSKIKILETELKKAQAADTAASGAAEVGDTDSQQLEIKNKQLMAKLQDGVSFHFRICSLNSQSCAML